MAINIQNLLNVINTKVQALDSSSDNTEVIKLVKLADNINTSSGVLEYRSRDELPAADSAYIGQIVYVQDKLVDQYGSFYYGLADSWQKLTLTADSDEANISFGPTSTFGGTNYGYVSGGYNPGSGYLDTIMKNSYTSDANATDVGNLLSAAGYHSGHSSETHGYNSGAWVPVSTNRIQKFTFSVDANATDVGDLLGDAYKHSSSSSSTHGYTAGGVNSVPTTDYTVIQKFPFATDGNATDVGDLVLADVDRTTGQSSSTYGYTSGSANGNPDGIQKYSYASDGNSTDVGNLTVGRARLGGASSSTYGYALGGYTPLAVVQNVIDKFSFASDGDATDVGDLTQSVRDTGGTSSTTHGYRYGGAITNEVNVIDKVSFSSDGNSTDVGDMLYASQVHCNVGSQY